VSGTIERIHVISRHEEAPEAVEAVLAEAGLGLRGDRHHGAAGGDLTLIEAEVVERLAAESGLDLSGGESRRNLVTRGLDLGSLVGRRFTIGDVLCEGERRCEPCEHLASLTSPAVLRGLAHSGLRASIIRSGQIRVGDPIEPLATSASLEEPVQREGG
jgi:MOSC domain-containing protein YiiM